MTITRCTAIVRNYHSHDVGANLKNRKKIKSSSYSPLIVNLGIVCVCVCLSILTHISVTAGRNFLILGMMMGYGLGMMPLILKL